MVSVGFWVAAESTPSVGFFSVLESWEICVARGVDKLALDKLDPL